MILVPSRQQLLSGNNSLIILSLLAFLSACSPKVAPVKPGDKQAPPKEKTEKPIPVKKNLDHSIVLLLPFELNTLNVKTASRKDISKAELAIDFYQGFKLALDSLSETGHNYKLQVFDTEDQETRMVNLARANSVRNNDLIIGPVYPEQISTFTEFSEIGNALQVSPLAASMPSQFKNPKLVTVNNTIDQHGWKIADFINRNYKADQVNIVLINTQKTDDAKFAEPVKKYLNELSSGKFNITERPNAIDLETYLKSGKKNLVIISSSDRMFLLPTIDRLYKLSRDKYKIEVFGHPNWLKAKFLDPEKMQGLSTRLSSSYFVNYKAENVKHFIARYRDEYGFEPSEFAFKGFDIGYYFGGLLEKYDKAYPDHLGDVVYRGLHNNLRFRKDPDLGYLNTELLILKYQSFELQLVK